MKIISKHKAEPFKTPEEEDLINKLPKSILQKIFSKLDFSSLLKCSLVSKGWNRVVLDERKNVIEINGIERFGKTGTLKDFSFRKNSDVTDKEIREYFETHHGIEKLDLYGCKNLTDRSLEYVVASCSGLVKLDIGSCQLTDAALKAISKSCSNLEFINISWCEKVTDEGVIALGQGCRILETFMCKGCSSISGPAIQNLTFLCPYLKVINIGWMEITDATVLCISNNCILLQHLCLDLCKDLSDVSLLALAKCCQNLKILEVSGCVKFTDMGFSALAESCPFLEKMDLEDCALITDKTLSSLAVGCPRLQNLSLSSCKQITDEGVRFLSQGVCANSSMTVLALDNLPLLTDKCIDYLLSFKKLERVELYDCMLITSHGLSKLNKHPSSKLKVHGFYTFETKENIYPWESNKWCYLYSDVIIVIIFVFILLACLTLVTLTYGYFTFFNYFTR